jgi:hypothetical protein
MAAHIVSFTLLCSKSFWQCKCVHQYILAACGEQKTSFCMGILVWPMNPKQENQEHQHWTSVCVALKALSMRTYVQISWVTLASKCAWNHSWHPWLQECFWILGPKAVKGIPHTDAYGFVFIVFDVVWINQCGITGPNNHFWWNLVSSVHTGNRDVLHDTET